MLTFSVSTTEAALAEAAARAEKAEEELSLFQQETYWLDSVVLLFVFVIYRVVVSMFQA